jgi:hypothetical protein
MAGIRGTRDHILQLFLIISRKLINIIKKLHKNMIQKLDGMVLKSIPIKIIKMILKNYKLSYNYRI